MQICECVWCTKLHLATNIGNFHSKRSIRCTGQERAVGFGAGCKPSMPTKRFSVYIFSESSGIIKSYILLQKQPSVPLCVTIAYTLKKKANNSYSSPPLPPVKHEV